MDHHQPVSRIERAAGLLLLLGVVASVIGVVMFQVRGGASGGLAPSADYYVWERSFFATAVAFTAVGFVLFADHPNLGAGRVLARAGATAYLFGGIVGVVAETMDLTSAAVDMDPLLVVYVVLAFLAQAAIGGGLRQGDLLAPWIGWTTIVEPGLAVHARTAHAVRRLLPGDPPRGAASHRWRPRPADSGSACIGYAGSDRRAMTDSAFCRRLGITAPTVQAPDRPRQRRPNQVSATAGERARHRGVADID